MKYLRFLACLFVGLIACLCFTACSDDDKDSPETPSSILGTWESKTFDEDDGEYYMTSLTFEKDGVGIVAGEYPESPEDNFRHPFKWKLGGDIDKKAILTIEGVDADGEGYINEIYRAQIIGQVLFLIDNQGDISSWNRKE